MNINKYIDHTALKPNADKATILKLIEEAKQYDYASVCINPCWVKLAAEKLQGTDVKVCTVIGFPLGANTAKVKVFEAQDAIENGATEVDMVINVGMLKDKNYEYVQNEIAAIVDAAKGKALVKVIIETCLLTDEEIVIACQLAQKAGADFVKTSTGFSTGGATVEDVRLMRQTVGSNMGVKASGGVHTHEEALAMIEAGASRIGASAGVKLLK